MFSKRQYKLLELISYEKRWFSLKEIAENLDCSTKTIQRDISQIKDNLPKDWSVQVTKNKGIKLKRPLSSSINSIQIKYFRYSLLFQTLQILLNQQINTIEHLSQKLYIQNTKMRSVLVEVEEHLKHYELTLKKRPLRIEGNEINIIQMYYELYLKAYDSQEWPFYEFQQDMFKILLHEIEIKLDITLYKESIRKLSFFMALYLIRNKKRLNIPIHYKIIGKVYSSSIYKIIEPIVTKVFKKYNVKSDCKDVVIFIIAINHVEFYYKKRDVIQKQFLFSIENKNIYKHFQDLIKSLEYRFHINLCNDDEFIFCITKIIQFYLSELQPFIVKQPIKSTTVYIKNKHLDTFDIIHTEITKWFQNLDVNHYISENDIADLTMHIEVLKMKTIKKNKKIILLLNNGENWERYLKQFIKSYFNKYIDFINIPYNQLSNTNLNTQEINCIITDTNLTSKINHSIPIILISPIPTKRDWDEIKKFIM
ncbi:helix-turn-helix domain-containing protein [Bacillus wiedmannii]|uniref:helix-turn-helix domain-containing protein n=1 Tax=Bacillus wiedmannii TaxID=1890302 RepID=UPI000BF118C3|nr:helix-turn-helix domain-containing protein [Bacillus wiedmannii]MDP1460065.1 helix-turn-helix domain-containing protein [Bacillus wiedmannii]PEJ61519.1 hypothetical protein CN685_27275 [Bacillus wiedmannii]